jgi:hypothetical protein
VSLSCLLDHSLDRSGEQAEREMVYIAWEWETVVYQSAGSQLHGGRKPIAWRQEANCLAGARGQFHGRPFPDPRAMKSWANAIGH